MTQLFINGKIHTMDATFSLAEAVVVRAGSFAFVGSNEQARAIAGADAKVVDLGGRVVLPSFIDAHLHLQAAALGLSGVDISTCGANLQKIQAKLRRFIAKHPKATIIKGFGWTENDFSGIGPRKEDLDAVSSEIPIALIADTGHSMWLNTPALAAAGIGGQPELRELAGLAESAELAAGGAGGAAGIGGQPDSRELATVERNERGEPAGTIRNDAMNAALSAMPDMDSDAYIRSLEMFFRHYASLGVTGYFEAWTNMCGPAMTDALRRYATSGKMLACVRGSYVLYPFMDVPAQIARYAAARADGDAEASGGMGDAEASGGAGADGAGGTGSGAGGAEADGDTKEQFKADTIKLFIDGAYETGRTGFLLQPYANNSPEDADYRGVPLWQQDKLNDAVALAFLRGFRVHVHCIGDAAVRMALDAFEEAIRARGLSGQGVIAHCENVAPEDFARFRELGVIAVVHPIWAQWDPWSLALRDVIGEERSAAINPIGSFVHAGVTAAAATDFPALSMLPTPPLVGIEQAVTRQMSKHFQMASVKDFKSGRYDEPLGPPAERLSLDEAVALYTVSAAKSLGVQAHKGSIEPGKDADFIVLDSDIYQADVHDISRAKVYATYFGGQEIFSRRPLKLLRHYLALLRSQLTG